MTLAYDVQADTAAPAMADLMRRVGVKMHFAKEEEIFAQDEQAEFVHLVVSGAVRTSWLLSDGRRQVTAFYYPGELVGFEPGPAHRFSAEAMCDCTVLAAPRSALRASGADFDRAQWDATRQELERTQEHLLMLCRKSALERVAGFLMSLAVKCREGAVLPMSRQDIADYLGLTIETVSRMLTRLQFEAVVEFDGPRSFKVKRWRALEAIAA